MPTLFEKIIAGDLPATVLYRDSARDSLFGHSARGAGAYTHSPEQTHSHRQ